MCATLIDCISTGNIVDCFDCYIYEKLSSEEGLSQFIL